MTADQRVFNIFSVSFCEVICNQRHQAAATDAGRYVALEHENAPREVSMASKKKPGANTPVGLRKLRLTKTVTDVCSNAFLILKHTHESSQALLTAYKLARAVRGFDKTQDGEEPRFTIRGMSTDEEQDLLRAMLVTTASGLDAMTKQLIREALPVLLEIEPEALDGLEKFVRKRIKGEIEDEFYEGTNFLARILISPSTQKQVIEDYINHLTKGSLQSSQELARVSNALGLSQKEITIDHRTLKPIFETRNKIIHELDINLNAPRRNRNVRSESEMRSYTNTLLKLAENLLEGVDEKIRGAT